MKGKAGTSKETLPELKKIYDLFEKDLFNRGAFELKNLIDADEQKYMPLIKAKYKELALRSSFSEALSVGTVIFAYEKDNAVLANQLGNFARKLGDLRQSISFYRQALKSTDSGSMSLYNLGAALANVEYYDNEALHAVTSFESSLEFVLPYYVFPVRNQLKPNPGYIEEVRLEIIKRKKKKCEEIVKQCELQMAEIDRDSFEFVQLKKKIKEVENRFRIVSEDDYVSFFQSIIKNNQSKKDIDWILYNLSIYYVSINQYVLGFKSLSKIKTKANFRYYRLMQGICLNLYGKIKEAFKIFSQGLSEDRYDRLFNVNTGLIYRKMGKPDMAARYLIATFYLRSLSKGMMDHELIIEHAKELFLKKDFVESERLLEMMIAEKRNYEEIYYYLSLIKIENEEHERATNFLGKLIASGRRFKSVAELLVSETHQELVEKAENNLVRKKYQSSLAHFKQALLYKSDVETMKKTLNVYHFITPNESDLKYKDALRKKMMDMMAEEKKKNEEKKRSVKEPPPVDRIEEERKNLIIKGKSNIVQKKYYMAVQLLERAFRMRPDKELFVQLASLYKGLKKNSQLFDLAVRFKQHQEREAKHQEREARYRETFKRS